MPPRPKLERWCRDQLSEPPVYLDVAERSVVKAACERHSKIRGWHVHALNPRTNHVHILITASDTKPEIVRDQLKANATGDLRRARLRFLTRY